MTFLSFWGATSDHAGWIQNNGTPKMKGGSRYTLPPSGNAQQFGTENMYENGSVVDYL
jgi:hypothetical protein